jgi:hypothetical protein
LPFFPLPEASSSLAPSDGIGRQPDNDSKSSSTFDWPRTSGTAPAENDKSDMRKKIFG